MGVTHQGLARSYRRDDALFFSGDLLLGALLDATSHSPDELQKQNKELTLIIVKALEKEKLALVDLPSGWRPVMEKHIEYRKLQEVRLAYDAGPWFELPDKCKKDPEFAFAAFEAMRKYLGGVEEGITFCTRSTMV